MRSEGHAVGSPAAPSQDSLTGERAGHPAQMPCPLCQPPKERIHYSVGGRRSETQRHWGL